MTISGFVYRETHNMYRFLNDNSLRNPTLGRLASVPVALLDIGMDTFRHPLQAISDIASAAISLLSVPFGGEIKYILTDTEYALQSIAMTPVALAMAPFKLFYQIIVIAINPSQARPFCY